MSLRTPICLTLPGSGTLMGVLAGACEVLEERHLFVAAGGTSGGGMVALALAAGMSAAQVSEMCSAMLVRKDLLDKGWPFDQRPGLYKGKVIEGILKDVFGKKRLKDLQIPCRVTIVDVSAQRPAILDSVEHGDVLCYRAARATGSVEGLFDIAIVHEDNPLRMAGDGGLILNEPSGLWDDRPEPTLSLRFSARPTLQELIQQGHMRDGHKKTVKTWADLAVSAANTLLGAAATTMPSTKSAYSEIFLSSTGDGMQFGLTAAEVERRRQEGRAAALAYGGAS